MTEILDTVKNGFKLLFPASHPNPPANPTARTPVTNDNFPATGVIDLQAEGRSPSNLLMLMPLAIGAAGVDVRLAVIGWRHIDGSSTGDDEWMPFILLDADCDCGGANFTLLGASVRRADIIAPAASVGLEGSSSVVLIRQQTGAVDSAAVVLDVVGFQRVEVMLSDLAAGGTASTGANVLWALL